MTPTIRIAVADDHALFRAGLVELLGHFDGFDVVADSASGEDTVRIAADVKPDVLTLDVTMPGPGAAATIAAVRQVSANTAVVIVTMMDDPALVTELIHAGATAFLLKNSSPLELSTAIRTAASAQDTVFVSVSRACFNRLGGSAPPTADILSAREREVLTLLGQAKSNRQISEQLHISDATVKRHLTHIYSKLGATGRAQATITAQRTGLIPRQH